MGFDSADNKDLLSLDSSVQVNDNVTQQTVATPVASVPVLPTPPSQLYSQPLMYVYAPQGTFPVEGNSTVCAIPCGQLVYPQLGEEEVGRRHHGDRIGDREERRLERREERIEGRWEARDERHEDREDRREARGERREHREERREVRGDRRDCREERREDRRVDRWETREDRREDREDRRDCREERREDRDDRREGRGDRRWERIEGRVETRWDRRDDRDDRREGRGEDRWDRREERVEARFDRRDERREDRGDARWDRREGRVEARWDRREDREERRAHRAERRSNRRVRLAKASLITYIIGMLSFIPYPASAAVTIHMFRKRLFERHGCLILAFAILELIAWTFGLVGVSLGYFHGDCSIIRIALISWWFFGLSFGIPRIALVMRHRNNHSYDLLEYGNL